MVMDFCFFMTAANFPLCFLKKMKFSDNSLNFYYFGKKIRSRRHLLHLSMLKNLFLKNMSKFRVNLNLICVSLKFNKNDF